MAKRTKITVAEANSQWMTAKQNLAEAKAAKAHGKTIAKLARLVNNSYQLKRRLEIKGEAPLDKPVSPLVQQTQVSSENVLEGVLIITKKGDVRFRMKSGLEILLKK